jgi:hypothetical protein
MDELKSKEMLPSICFNDDRDFCEQLAIHVFNDYEMREKRYMDSAEFKRRFNFKAEDRMAKIAKREKAAKERAKKKKLTRDEDGRVEVQENDMDDDMDNEEFSVLRMVRYFKF